MKQLKELPEWFLNMSEDAFLNAKDVALLFGYKTASSINALIYQGSFSKPDRTVKANKGYRNLWSKKTILSEIERRKL